MGSECSVLFLIGHAVVFSRETNVWLSVEESVCVVCQLLHWLIKLCRVLGCQKARSTRMV